VASCRSCQQKQLEVPQLSQELQQQVAAAPADLIMLETEARKRKSMSKIGFRTVMK
jgi:hypothetical protein